MADDDDQLIPAQVEIVSPIPSEDHPVRLGACRAYIVGPDEPVRILNSNDKRTTATIYIEANWIRVGNSRDSFVGEYPALLSTSKTVSLTHTSEMWAKGDTGQAIVSVIEEYSG
jgi:hypothetical protein